MHVEAFSGGEVSRAEFDSLKKQNKEMMMLMNSLNTSLQMMSAMFENYKSE